VQAAQAVAAHLGLPEQDRAAAAAAQHLLGRPQL
jgi:hypothetical protein